jgi:hypothetical protein
MKSLATRRALCIWCALCLSLLIGSLVMADEKADKTKTHTLTLGKFQVKAPAEWTRQEPKSPRIVAYEFSAPAAEGDKQGGRLTIGSLGGGVESNLDRWIAQFTQPDGKSSKEKAKIEKKKIAEQEVHVLDVSGTYRDPFNPELSGENNRLLAAVVITNEAAFFFKFNGPQKTIATHEKAFHKMLESLAVK